MSEAASSRRASTESQHSQRSHAESFATQRQHMMPSGPRQASISMFTGRSDIPPSPAHSVRSDGPSSAFSPGSIDRVFPIRSAVSVDPFATPMIRNESADGFPGMNLGMEGGIAARREQSKNNQETRSDSSTTKTIQAPAVESHERPSMGESQASSNTVQQDDIRRASDATTDSMRSSTGRAGHQYMDNILRDDSSSKSAETSSLSGGVALGSRANSIRSGSIKSEAPEGGLITARFKHVVTDGGHAVITGRDGETLQRCEDEPIHIPGAVQGFGLLIAFKEEDGKLIVHVVSENSARIIGYTPTQLFKLDNFLDILTEEQADNLLDHLDFIRDDEAADVVNNGPEVFMLSIRPPQHRTRKLWCAMHLPDGDRDMVVCEFEVEDDPVNPLVPADEQATPELPEDTIGSEPTAEEFTESTVNISKPLRVLRSARKKRGEAAAMEVFNIMSQVQEQLANAPTLQVFLKVLIGVVKELTGFHRVMIYQFDQAWNGRVVAELVDPRATKDLFKGLNFPASDIPKQARELYKLNKVRLLYDRSQETARLVCRTVEDLEKPLDLSHAYLRAMSPIHIKYLANMAVRSSMSISINAFGELWGLIACHTYGTKGMRVSFPIRKMCRLVGDTASRNIERLSYASRLQARKLINTTSSAANPSGYIVASSDDLLKLFDADVGALSIRDETKIMGQTQGHMQEVLAMLEFLRMRRLNSVYSSQDINMDFPDFRYAPGLKFIAGVLYVPLSNSGGDFIAFFRRGVLQEVKWAGNPYEKFVKEGTEGYLEPRKSFKTWSETIVGRCRDWTEEEIETASVLCLVYGKFIDVWRQKEAALQNSQLTKLLLANSAHEVRTPLNAIINYLEIALEGSLDNDTRENLAKSHSASKSLVYVINDLLDLTKTESSKDLVKEELFDLDATLHEATSPFVGDSKRKNIDYQVTISPDLPKRVVGDQRRVRQVVSNLIANAFQHTTEGSVTVHAWVSAEQSSLERKDVEFAVEDTGAGMPQAKVDALFRELEEVSYEQEIPTNAILDRDAHSENGKAVEGHSTLGLGLAVVARIVRNMNGQLRLKTEEGKGSRFIIMLSFETEKDHRSNKLQRSHSPAKLTSPSPSTPAATEGEVMLVDRNAPKRSDAGSMVRKQSADSMHSLSSIKSNKSIASMQSDNSGRSDAERLIDAIQEPLHLQEGNKGRGKNNMLRTQSDGSPAKSKANSIGSARDLKSALHRIPGQETVTDSGIPIKPVRMPEMGMENESGRDGPRIGAKVTFSEPQGFVQTPEQQDEELKLSPENFSILVAEDDPVNSKIIKRRLEKLGHAVYMTVNGEECSSAHGEQPRQFDAVLMDLQVSNSV